MFPKTSPEETATAIAQSDDMPLIGLPEAGRALPVPRTRATMRRWLHAHPDLGLWLGGRGYVWRHKLSAIATGTSLADAAKLAGAGRDQRAA